MIQSVQKKCRMNVICYGIIDSGLYIVRNMIYRWKGGEYMLKPRPWWLDADDVDCSLCPYMTQCVIDVVHDDDISECYYYENEE